MVIRWKIIHGVFRKSQLRDVLGNTQSHEVLTIFTEQASMLKILHSLRISPQVKNTSFVLNRPIGQNKITIKLKNTDTAYNTDSTQK